MSIQPYLGLTSSSNPQPGIDAAPQDVDNHNINVNAPSTIIGIYGISGSGKTHLLRQLKDKLAPTHFAFYDGSEMIAATVPGGLAAFQQMKVQQQYYWRARAITEINYECSLSGKTAIVAGHYMFWPEGDEFGTSVCTDTDLEAFRHMIYLETPIKTILQRCSTDTAKPRPVMPESHLRKWQQEEKSQLRAVCRSHDILFIALRMSPTLPDQVAILASDFRRHCEEYNISQAKLQMCDLMKQKHAGTKTMVILDADKTLAAEDTGLLFWEKIEVHGRSEHNAATLTELFQSPLKYSYKAFRQATLLYEEVSNDVEFDVLCADIASSVKMYPEIVSLIRTLGSQSHIAMVVVTSGIRRVWQKVLAKEGLSGMVEVIGGGRVSDGIVVGAADKRALVSYLQEGFGLYTWAFGDSPLDLGMMRVADQAIIVVGEERTRSKSMDAALATAVDHHGLRGRQVLLPFGATPRLDVMRLPIINITDAAFLAEMTAGHTRQSGMRVICDTDRPTAKLLATPMRDAGVAGPALREAHRRAGWYLATQHLADVVGLEPRPIQHVLGRPTEGYQIQHEEQTTIVALMRGGEPMASGVSDACPRAMMVHAKEPEDLKLHHLAGQQTVILVDSVINTGKSIIEFVDYIRKVHGSIRIVVIAGVIQAQCVSPSGLGKTLAGLLDGVTLIGLRTSDTKFAGSKTTDTGNRLFNTTHLA